MRAPEDIRKYHVHYDEDRLLGKVIKVARKAGEKLVYTVLLLFYVLKSPSVTKGDKTTIIGALGYFILPLDLIPDFIPFAGFTDDLSALMLALHAVWKNITPEIKELAASKAREIFGEFNQDDIDEQINSTF